MIRLSSRMSQCGRQPSLASVESVKFEGRGTFVPGLLGAIGQGNVGACRDGVIKVDRPSGVIGQAFSAIRSARTQVGATKITLRIENCGPYGCNRKCPRRRWGETSPPCACTMTCDGPRTILS